MDGVSGAFAVISLAIQLAETGKKISTFITNVQDAPSEVVRLGQVLDQLSGTLKQVSHLLEQQYLVLRLPGSPVFITNALENCEKRIKGLEEVTQKAKKQQDHPNQMRRSWAALRFVFEKDDIREMQSQLRDAETGLQTAMLSNSWQLQMHSFSVTETISLQARNTKEALSAEPVNSISTSGKVQRPSSVRRGVSSTIAREANSLWYDGIFGNVIVSCKSKTLPRSDTRSFRDRVISEEKVIKIRPAFLRKNIELRFLNSFGQISRTLRICPVLDSGTPIFDLCRHGDLQGLKFALSSGTISPFVSNQSGWSLLHYAAAYSHTEMCAFLLQVGVDADREDSRGLTAICEVTGRSDPESAQDMVDIMRLLTQTQNETSPRSISNFWGRYNGPVQGAEFMLSQDLIPLESDDSDDRDGFPLLATTLKKYAEQASEWEAFLRLLVRKGVDLHSPVPREYVSGDMKELLGPMYPCEISECGTPLDELFARTETPFEGEVAADRWLQILSSEGYDVNAYLEEESALHSPQMQLSCPSRLFNSYTVPRQLVYSLGTHPSLSWTWWIDPSFSTHLLRQEFKHMTTPADRSDDYPWSEWEIHWPWRYPAWSLAPDYSIEEDNDTYLDRQLRYKHAQERANRRLRKRARKMVRAGRLRGRDHMPGAWPV